MVYHIISIVNNLKEFRMTYFKEATAKKTNGLKHTNININLELSYKYINHF